MKLSYVSLVLLVFCVGNSCQQFLDWLNSDNTDTRDTSESSSPKTSLSSITTTVVTTQTLPTTARTRQRPTSGPSTTLSTTSRSTSTIRFRTTDQTISSTPERKPSSAQPVATTSTPLGECLAIELNAKITFKYESVEGYDQQLEIMSGSESGDLAQDNRCHKNQMVTVKYEQIERTQLVLWITFDETNIELNRIKFEYPVNRLPDGYRNTTKDFGNCSPDINTPIGSSPTKCLIAVNDTLNGYSFGYKREEQIHCKQLPPIVLKTGDTSEQIEVLLTNFRLMISNTKKTTFGEVSDGKCPLVSDSGDEGLTLFAGANKIWFGVAYAVVGAIIMFGTVFLYEKFVRNRFLYNQVVDNDQEIDVRQ